MTTEEIDALADKVRASNDRLERGLSVGFDTPSLKPCPFCGRAGRVEVERAAGADYCSVGCHNPKCLCYPTTGRPMAELQSLVKLWNTRTNPEVLTVGMDNNAPLYRPPVADDTELDLSDIRARNVNNAVFVENIGRCGNIGTFSVGTREFAADLAGELNAIFNGFRYAQSESARVASEYAHHVSQDRLRTIEHYEGKLGELAKNRDDWERHAERAEWKLKKLRQHLTWDGGATCDIGTMLGIIDGTCREPGGECGCCKAACHPDNNVCQTCHTEEDS